MTRPVRIFDKSYCAQKQFVFGTHRAQSPSETLIRFSQFMPAIGITRLANITGLDSIGFPVYTAIRPNSRSLATSQGKGITIESSKVSALMEGVEHWHAEHIRGILHRESCSDFLRRASVVNVEKLQLYKHGILQSDIPTLWIEGYDILQGRPIWVPHEAVSLDMVLPRDFRPTFDISSNGLAAGNHVLEAVVHGLCEVIERDAETLWRLNDQDWRQLDLNTVKDDCCVRTIELLRHAGVYLAAWDITADTKVPVYGCVILENPDKRSRPVGAYFGFGCHLSPGVALLRAISEAIQTRVTYISGSRDDILREDYDEVNYDGTIREIWKEVSSPAETVDFRNETLACHAFEEDVEKILIALREAGVESVVVVDLTKPDINIPVVKIIVPGLEGPYERCRLGSRAEAMMKETGE